MRMTTRVALICILKFWLIVQVSGQNDGIGAWQFESAPKGTKYVFISNPSTGVWDTMRWDIFLDSLDVYLGGGGGGGYAIDSMRCVSDSLRIYSGPSVIKTPLDCSKTNEIQNLYPYVVLGDTIGMILSDPNSALQDTLIFDNSDYAAVPNLVPLVSGGDTIGAVLAFENPLLNDTILFEYAQEVASFWQSMILTDTVTSTSSSTWTPVFAFQPGENERIRIRAQVIIYTETAGVGTRGRFSISGGVAGYESYSVRFLWPNGTDAVIVKNGGYSGTPWEVLPTSGEALTHQIGTIEILLKTVTSPNPITISIQSETGAAVHALPGSIFEYKQY